jgi:hypothetical protein
MLADTAITHLILQPTLLLLAAVILLTLCVCLEALAAEAAAGFLAVRLWVAAAEAAQAECFK